MKDCDLILDTDMKGGWYVDKDGNKIKYIQLPIGTLTTITLSSSRDEKLKRLLYQDRGNPQQQKRNMKEFNKRK